MCWAGYAARQTGPATRSSASFLTSCGAIPATARRLTIRGRQARTTSWSPLRIRLGGDELSFLSTTTVFGSPLDITVAEPAIESFYPLDGHTAAAMRAFAPAGR
jgi:hypothetical protein